MKVFIKRQLNSCSRILIGICICVCFLAGCSKKMNPPLTIDAFGNMSIKYSGWDGEGTAKVLNQINYVGNNKTISNFLKTIDYKIKPNKNLKNGDEIVVTLSYIDTEKKLANVEFKSESKTFIVSGLTKLNEKKLVTEEDIVEDDNGEELIKYTERYIVNGIEIPVEWNLSDEEMEEYVTYMQNSQNQQNQTEEIPIERNWTQGTSEKTTHRKNADFYSKDYLNNAVTTYNDAYNYGITSSQEFKIEPILEEETSVGYRVIFKED